MDAQDFRSLQEAYMEVVENQQLDEGYKTRNAAKIMNKKDSLRRKGDLESLGRAGDIERKLYRRDFSAQNPDVEERINKLREPKRSKLVSDNNKKKTFGNRLTRSDGQGIHDSYEYDLYDIVLSHLLDEGYAETPEAAEVIMVNMSEEWRENIIDTIEVYEDYLDEGLGTAIRGLFGKKKEEIKKPLSRGEQLRKKYNVGPERSDTSAKRQILNRSRARAEKDEREYGNSRYSKSVATKSRAAHDRYLKAGYSKYGADQKYGSGNKARRRAEGLSKED